MDTIALAVSMRADASDVEGAFEDVGDAAKSMAADVSAAAADVDAAASKLDNVSASAENLDDKAGKATGALGALSSGFELVGLEQYAGGLQAAAMATDFASGAGQALNLVIGLESVQRAKAAVQAGVHTAATFAQSAAAKAAAAGQFVLNAALAANPIGLVVAAIALLVGGLVLAYNKSETFRTIVQSVGTVGKAALGFIVDKATDLYTYISDKLTPVFDSIGPAADRARTLVTNGFDIMLAPIRAVRDAVQEVIAFIGRIKLPDLPNLPGLGFDLGGGDAFGGAGPVSFPGFGPSRGAGGGITLIKIEAIDPQAVVRLLRREGFAVGGVR